jgi:hypothetical protein
LVEFTGWFTGTRHDFGELAQLAKCEAEGFSNLEQLGFECAAGGGSRLESLGRERSQRRVDERSETPCIESGDDLHAGDRGRGCTPRLEHRREKSRLLVVEGAIVR